MMSQRPFTEQRGKPVELETVRFRLRSLKPIDAPERWLRWSRDPEVTDPANDPGRDLTRDQLASYIGTHDNDLRYMIGIFAKESGIQIGWSCIEVDRPDDTATFHTIIGEKDWWGRAVVNEARAALLDHFFDHLIIAKACGCPLSRNFPAIFNYKAQGWIYEGTLRGHIKSVIDGSRLDQLRFRLFPHEWRAVRDRGKQSNDDDS
jgi:RimJ/RimL family protein N-acetyltransferase